MVEHEVVFNGEYDLKRYAVRNSLNEFNNFQEKPSGIIQNGYYKKNSLPYKKKDKKNKQTD